MREIRFGGKLTCQDFIKINRYHFKNSNIKTFLAQVCAYLIIALSILADKITSIPRLILLLFLTIGLGFITAAIFNCIRIKKLKCVYKSSKGMETDKIYITKEEGLLCKDEKGDSLIKWKDIYKIEEKPDMILIYTTPIQTAAILKSFFETESDLAEFKKILRDKVLDSRISFIE
ncbi:MAG: YcxB family protein [Clostridia bacterium]|nr:YcxB family protein [Clostridia bacterium]